MLSTSYPGGTGPCRGREKSELGYVCRGIYERGRPCEPCLSLGGPYVGESRPGEDVSVHKVRKYHDGMGEVLCGGAPAWGVKKGRFLTSSCGIGGVCTQMMDAIHAEKSISQI